MEITLAILSIVIIQWKKCSNTTCFVSPHYGQTTKKLSNMNNRRFRPFWHAMTDCRNPVSERDRHHCSTSGNIPKTEGGHIFTSSLWQACKTNEIRLTQKEDLLEQKYFPGSIPLVTPNHCHKLCGDPEAFTSTTIFMKCGAKLACEGRSAT